MSAPSLVSDILLLGPIRAGKSTVGRLLAEALNVPQVSLDALCRDYYREIGFDEPGTENNGPDGMIAARFHLHAVARLLEEHRECVIDFGAGHSVFSEAADLHQAQQLLAHYPNIFLLLPSPDPTVSDTVLAERNRHNDWLQTFLKEKGWNPNASFVRHPANFALARQIVYTEGKSPEQTRDEILERIEQNPRAFGRHTRTRQKSEMIAKLTRALEAAEEGQLRSLVLMTTLTNGNAECWARIAAEDQRETCEFLAQLQRDIECH